MKRKSKSKRKREEVKEEKKQQEGGEKKTKGKAARKKMKREKRKWGNLTVALLIRKECLCAKMRGLAEKSYSHCYPLPR